MNSKLDRMFPDQDNPALCIIGQSWWDSQYLQEAIDLGVKPEMFAHPVYRALWTAMVEAWGEGVFLQPSDLRTAFSQYPKAIEIINHIRKNAPTSQSMAYHVSELMGVA